MDCVKLLENALLFWTLNSDPMIISLCTPPLGGVPTTGSEQGFLSHKLQLQPVLKLENVCPTSSWTWLTLNVIHFMYLVDCFHSYFVHALNCCCCSCCCCCIVLPFCIMRFIVCSQRKKYIYIYTTIIQFYRL